MKIIEKQVSNKIANASIICALLVVLIHTNTTAAEGSPIWWLHICISKGIGRMAVPFFFAVSGFLFAGHFGEDGWWARENRKRIRSLLVPYLVFCIGMFALLVGSRVAANIMAHRPMLDADITNPWYYIRGFGFSWDEPIHGAMWYVRGLLVVVFLSPLVKLALRLKWGALILAFGLEFVFYRYLPSMKLHPLACTIPSVGFAYFTAGAYLRVNDWDGRSFSRLASWGLVFVGIALTIARNALVFNGILVWPEYFTAIATPLMCVGLWGVIPSTRWPIWLTSASFPIYCLHYLVGFPLFFLAETAWIKSTFCGWFARAALLFGGSLLLTVLLRKMLPRFAQFILGGR